MFYFSRIYLLNTICILIGCFITKHMTTRQQLQVQGTVVPAQPFFIERRIQDISKAMRGLGVDKDVIVRWLSSHSNLQRQALALNFERYTGKDLRQELQSEISGKFKDLVLALLDSPIVFDSKEMHDAISITPSLANTLTEILFTRSNEEILDIEAAYKTLYKANLEHDVIRATSGHFQDLLVCQLAASREEPTTVDNDKADEDADAFFKAVSCENGTDYSELNRLFCQRSYPQLSQMFESYSIKYDQEVESCLECENSISGKIAYIAIAQIARNTPLYFAQQLQNSMKAVGTDDRTLIRIVVSRSEVDMVQIKHEFKKQYGKTLGRSIEEETIGPYKDLLLALCDED